MLHLNYFMHILLNSKYQLFINLFIIFIIYLVLYGNNAVYCMLEDNHSYDKFYIYWPGDSNGVSDGDVEYYALKDYGSRQQLLEHRANVSAQKNQLDHFILKEFKLHIFHAYNQGDPRLLEVSKFTRGYDLNYPIYDENLPAITEDFLTRNKKPFIELDYSGLKINNQTFIDNRGKIIREIITNKHPCDCFSTTKRYVDVYYPSYHPDNGLKPHSEVSRHLIKSKSNCYIS